MTAHVLLRIMERDASSGIQPGTFGAMVGFFPCRVIDISKFEIDNESAIEALPFFIGDEVVTISGTPDNWTISIPETTVGKQDAYTGKNLGGTATFSFNFTGKLVKGNPIRSYDEDDD